MRFSLRFQPNPFPFLLYTEWVLLGSCGSLAIVEAFKEQQIPVQHILILLTLWALGLRLPLGSRWVKFLYTGLEISLIFYGALMGYLHILPMLYLIVVIRSCFLFKASERWTIAIFTFFLFLLHQINYVRTITQLVEVEYQQRFWMHLIAETLMFGLGLFLVLKLANALLVERDLRADLVMAHKQLQQYAQQDKELAALQERNRIARNIHDSLGHALTALNVQLQAAIELWRHDRERVEPFLEQAQKLGETAMQEVRKSVSTLREDAQPEQPLTEAIAELVEDFRQGTGIRTTLEVNINVAISVSASHAIYRIVQEALTNIYKHAQATTVNVCLEGCVDTIRISVKDDGRGFHRNGSPIAGFGLQGIQERVAALRGKFNLITESGEGCQVKVEIPLNPMVVV
ncbi:sensor histidine kinase [Phormidium tenue FACHB-886]|nr:sensor histidine kinase [Phormidium tenue FACHB-886]